MLFSFSFLIIFVNPLISSCWYLKDCYFDLKNYFSLIYFVQLIIYLNLIYPYNRICFVIFFIHDFQLKIQMNWVPNLIYFHKYCDTQLKNHQWMHLSIEHFPLDLLLLYYGYSFFYFVLLIRIMCRLDIFAAFF